MTREEEIMQQALNYAEKIDYNLWLDTEHPKTYAKMLVMATAEDNAQWADEHPKNPWKDASVEKPPYDTDCDDETSVYVIVRQEQGNVLEAYYDYDNKDWRDREHNWRLQDPTNWMPIPELKEGKQ